MNSFIKILVAVVFVFAFVQESSGLRCWQQICRECSSDEINGPGNDVMCEFRNLIVKTWLDDTNYEPSKPYSSSENLEFQCLKLTASDPKVSGDSTDVIRGCVLKSEAKGICTELKTIEGQRGKTNAKCDICDGDICNGAMGRGVTSMLLIFLSIFVTFLFY